MILFIIIAIIVIFLILRKTLFKKFDNVILYTGGLGSGKSLESAKTARRLLRRNRRKWRWYGRLAHLPFKKWKKKHAMYMEKPMLYSNIPLYLGRGEYSLPLTDNIMLGIEYVPPMSIVFVDEVAIYLSQMTNTFIDRDELEIFVSLYRHFTKGGFVILNTQNVSKVNCIYRYCSNQSVNLSKFRHIWRIYWVQAKNVTLCDDIKQIEVTNDESNTRLIVGIIPKRLYDTYAFSELYPALSEEERNFTQMKAKKLLRHRIIKK